MSTVGHIALTIAGIVGLSGIISALKSSRRLSRYHRFFRFQRSERADMVLPTSARTIGGAGIAYRRTVTAVGNMRAAIVIAQMIGYWAPRRPVSVSVSAEVEQRLDGDLVLIGLPKKNAASALVLRHLQSLYPSAGLWIQEEADDEGGCWLGLAGFSEQYRVLTQEDSDVPDRDLALIVVWVNPLATVKRRLVWCAGFTAWGTSGAAAYLVDDIVPHRLKRLRQENRSLPSLWRRRWTCFAMIVETRIVNDQVVEVQERAFVPLPDPGCPPVRLTPGSPHLPYATRASATLPTSSSGAPTPPLTSESGASSQNGAGSEPSRTAPEPSDNG